MISYIDLITYLARTAYILTIYNQRIKNVELDGICSKCHHGVVNRYQDGKTQTPSGTMADKLNIYFM